MNSQILLTKLTDKSLFFAFQKCQKHSFRNFTTNRPNMTQKLHLMDTPRVLVSNPFETIMLKLKIAFNMFKIDSSFRLNQFNRGATQAMLNVSNSISQGDFESLKPLIQEDSLEIIKKNYALLNQEQKKLIGVVETDNQGMAPYLFQQAEDDSSSRTFVKIGVLFFYVPGFGDKLNKVFKPQSSVSEFTEAAQTFKFNLIVADYRFVREFKRDAETKWIISELNHWKVSDYKDEFPGQF